MSITQTESVRTETVMSPEQAQEQFVTRALEEQGRMRNGVRARVYQTLLSQLSTAGAPHYYSALAKCASLIKSEALNPLNSPFSALLTVVFELDYRTSSRETALAHVKFLLHLALANSGLMYPCFLVFCQCFKYEEWETREQVYDSIHVALRQILHLSPIASSSLFAAFLETYPHQRVDTPVQQAFIKNLLDVALYSDSLRSRILSLIVERLVALDVEVAGHLDSQADAGDTKAPAEPELQDKLDQMLSLLFDFLRRVRDSREPNARDVCNSIWECLSSVFNKTIIRAHKARYLPFLVFYHAKSYPKYSDRFLGLLKTKACDRQESEPERVHAAAYLAGFVARAAYIHAAQMRNSFDLILEDLYLYCVEKQEELPEEDLEIKIGPASASNYIVFYAMFQALMHMFNRRLCCGEDKKLQWDQMRYIIRSHLCPLRYCLASTVAEFRERTAELDLALDDISTWPSKPCTLRGLDDLFYFPFEPMPLPLCAVYINEPSLYLHHPVSLDADPSDSLWPPTASRRDKSPLLHSFASPPLRTPLTGPDPALFEPEPPVFSL